MKQSKNKYGIKLVICGDGAVGKTSLRERFMGRGFQINYTPTLGADFTTKTVDMGDTILHLGLWDLAGQPNFENVRHVYYNRAVASLLVFDITRRESFNNLGSWIAEIWKNNGHGIIPVVILGNKDDLRDEVSYSITNKEAVEYASTISEKTRNKGFDVKYFSTSAKSGKNVEKAFKKIGKMYMSTIGL
ncbi:MAG: Rab family GTPase [Candidatus Hodarchaeales archaeon]